MLFQVPQSNMICIFKNVCVEFHEWAFQHYVKLLDQTWVVVLRNASVELHEWIFQHYVKVLDQTWFVVLEMLVFNFMNEFFNIMLSF